MKYRVCLILVTLLVLTAALQATVPQTISYQGRLTTSSGQPVPDGNYSITFRFYADSIGGSPLWEEGRLVSAVNGLIAVPLGQIVPIPPNVFSQPVRFLEITVGMEVISPRVRLSSVAYAYRALNADTAAYATNAPASGWVDNGTTVRLTDSSDYVGVGTANAQAPLHVFGTTDVTSPVTVLQLQAASTGDYGDFSSFGPQISFRSEDSNPLDGDDREFARLSGGYLRSAENGVMDFSVLENGVMRKLMRLSGPSYVGGETPAGLMLNEPTSNCAVLNVRNGTANKYVAYFESTLPNEGIMRLTYTGDAASNIPFLEMKTTPSSNTDTRFRFMAGGDAYADGSWIGGGADFAEWFEKEGEIPVNSLIGLNARTGKVRAWQPGDPVIGVQSSAPGFVGNNAAGADRTCEELEQTRVLVALLGQVTISSAATREQDGQCLTSDGQFIGWTLANGKIYIPAPAGWRVHLEQVPREQQLDDRITELETQVAKLLSAISNPASLQVSAGSGSSTGRGGRE